MKTEIRKELGWMILLFAQVAIVLFAIQYASINFVTPSIHSGMQFSDYLAVSPLFFFLFMLCIGVITPIDILLDFFAKWTVVGVAWVYFRFR